VASAESAVELSSFDALEPRVAYAIWRLRQQVFVVEQECVYGDLDGRDLDPTTTHLFVRSGDDLIGYLRLLDEGDRLRIGRVVVAPAQRGAGLAGRLMERALDLVGGRPSYLHAQTHLVEWYERFGYARAGEDYLDDGILHTPMTRP
jgi:ElaA protein